MAISINKQLQFLLKKNNLSIAELSRATNISAKTLHQWTYGHQPRNFHQVYQVAKYFNVSLEFLLFGFDTNTPEQNLACGMYEILVIRKLNAKEGHQ